MMWGGKEIVELDDQMLIQADARLQQMKKLHDDKIGQRKARHENIELTTNPVYTQLANEVKQELTKRGLDKWR